MSNPIHKRERHSVATKKQVIKEALSGEETLAQIASDFGISPETVKDWKKQAWQAIEESLRRKGLRSELERKQKEIETLQKLLGQREFELDWQSKKNQRAGAVEQRHQLVAVHAHTLSRKGSSVFLILATEFSLASRRIRDIMPSPCRSICRSHENQPSNKIRNNERNQRQRLQD